VEQRNATPEGNPWAPSWFVDLIGVDYFGHVTDVGLFSAPTATSPVPAQVAHFTRLQRLRLNGTSVSDTELLHLKGLTDLSELYLSGPQVTDARLAHRQRASARTPRCASQSEVDALPD
jgi:hypothetical protein